MNQMGSEISWTHLCDKMQPNLSMTDPEDLLNNPTMALRIHLGTQNDYRISLLTDASSSSASKQVQVDKKHHKKVLKHC